MTDSRNYSISVFSTNCAGNSTASKLDFSTRKYVQVTVLTIDKRPLMELENPYSFCQKIGVLTFSQLAYT